MSYLSNSTEAPEPPHFELLNQDLRGVLLCRLCRLMASACHGSEFSSDPSETDYAYSVPGFFFEVRAVPLPGLQAQQDSFSPSQWLCEVRSRAHRVLQSCGHLEFGGVRPGSNEVENRL